jgi:hypothetical protein
MQFDKPQLLAANILSDWHSSLLLWPVRGRDGARDDGMEIEVASDVLLVAVETLGFAPPFP